MYLMENGWTEDAVKNYIDVVVENSKGNYIRNINKSLDSVYDDLERERKKQRNLKNYYKTSHEGRFKH